MRLALVLLLAPLAACVGDPAPPICTAEGECLVGYECVTGLCLECEPPNGCGGLRSKGFGAEGGTLCGPDEACIVIPASSLTVTSTVFVRRSTKAPPGNLDVRSGIYDFGPANTRLRVAAEVRIPISPSMRLSDIFICRAEGQGYVPLKGTTDAVYARGTTDKLGTFVAVRRPR